MSDAARETIEHADGGGEIPAVSKTEPDGIFARHPKRKPCSNACGPS